MNLFRRKCARTDIEPRCRETRFHLHGDEFILVMLVVIALRFLF